jgi:hypothetical protein
MSIERPIEGGVVNEDYSLIYEVEPCVQVDFVSEILRDGSPVNTVQTKSNLDTKLSYEDTQSLEPGKYTLNLTSSTETDYKSLQRSFEVVPYR